TVGAACASDGVTCGGPCSDVCSFCNILLCQSGRWANIETFPTPCFTCGPSGKCQTSKQYCNVTIGGVPGSQPSYRCTALPNSCLATPTCACLSTVPGTCQESGSGQITVTLAAP